MSAFSVTPPVLATASAWLRAAAADVRSTEPAARALADGRSGDPVLDAELRWVATDLVVAVVALAEGLGADAGALAAAAGAYRASDRAADPGDRPGYGPRLAPPAPARGRQP